MDSPALGHCGLYIMWDGLEKKWELGKSFKKNKRQNESLKCTVYDTAPREKRSYFSFDRGNSKISGLNQVAFKKVNKRLALSL